MNKGKAAAAKEIPGQVCAILSVGLGAFGIWMVLSISGTGGQWFFSVLMWVLPLLFGLQGLRLSKEPGATWPRFSRLASWFGMFLGTASFLGFLWLLARSS